KKGGRRGQTITVAKDAKISVDGKATKLADLQPGTPARLSLSGDGKTATAITVDGGTVAGAVKSVDATKNTITLAVRKKKSGEAEPDQTITVAKDAKISVGGETKVLGDIQTGAAAIVALSADKKTAFAVTVGGKKRKK